MCVEKLDLYNHLEQLEINYYHCLKKLKPKLSL